MAIWGATSPKLDVEPYYGAKFLEPNSDKPYDNILVPGLSCQPCSKYGTRRCPRGHFKCMKLQDVDKIVERALERIGTPLSK